MTEAKEFTWEGPRGGHFDAAPVVLDAPAGPR
jgi:hypothetical protein